MIGTGWDPESPSLLPAIVCYADILGFRALIERAYESGKEEEFLRQVKHSIAAAHEALRQAAKLGRDFPAVFDIKFFTDNIVVAYPLRDQRSNFGEPELGTLLMLFAQVQASLAWDGFFLRGAITSGDHYQDDDIAYSKALLEAVELDKSGGPPRIVIGLSVEPLIATQLSFYGNIGWAPHYEELLEDPVDGRLFVNYLQVAFDYFPEGPIIHELLAAHRENVSSGLRASESDLRVRKKYEWMAAYHNYVCLTFADRYSVQDYERADPEYIAVSEEAHSVINHLISYDDLTGQQPPRRLDAQRLQQKLADS